MELDMLRKIISDVLNVDVKEINLDTTFVDDLGADSLDLFQIVMGVEEQFNIKLTNEEASNITTVEDALNCIRSLVK